MKIHTIDALHQGNHQSIAVFVIETNHRPILIETGPSKDLPNVIDGLQTIGMKPTDFANVLVTHIHFDHAGAAGWWAEQGAQIYVHPRGAKHLIDPSRLLASARMVYGDMLDKTLGTMMPIPEAQVTILQDQDTVTFGEINIIAHDTPGHARHHHAYQIDDVVFTGDVAGNRLLGSPYIMVGGAPPQFDPDTFIESIARLKALNSREIYLTHFGKTDTVEQHWDDFRNQVLAATAFAEAHIRNGTPINDIHEQFYQYEKDRALRLGMTEEAWDHAMKANPIRTSFDGILLYWQKRLKLEQEELA